MNTSTNAMRCTRCGGTKFLPSRGGELRNEDVLTCTGCQHQIKVGDVGKQARQAAEKAVADSIRRAFK